MALLNGGFWPTTYWAEDYFDASYWPQFGSDGFNLIPAGYWQPRYWAKGYWAQTYWPRFSSIDIDTLLIPIGYWTPTYWVKGYWHQTYWPKYGAPAAPARRQFFVIRRTSKSSWREYFIEEEEN